MWLHIGNGGYYWSDRYANLHLTEYWYNLYQERDATDMTT
jgi:hypothetical protein